LSGKFPAILDDANMARPRGRFMTTPAPCLTRFVAERWFKAKRVAGFWRRMPSAMNHIYADEVRSKPIASMHALRQQLSKRDSFNEALSDLVAPRDSAWPIYIGGLHGYRRDRRRCGGRALQARQ